MCATLRNRGRLQPSCRARATPARTAEIFASGEETDRIARLAAVRTDRVAAIGLWWRAIRSGLEAGGYCLYGLRHSTRPPRRVEAIFKWGDPRRVRRSGLAARRGGFPAGDRESCPRIDKWPRPHPASGLQPSGKAPVAPRLSLRQEAGPRDAISASCPLRAGFGPRPARPVRHGLHVPSNLRRPGHKIYADVRGGQGGLLKWLFTPLPLRSLPPTSR